MTYGIHVDPATGIAHRNDHICNQQCRDLAAIAKADQKYVKVSLVIDDGETTSIQTFYRTRDISYSMDYVDPSPRSVVCGVSFKAECDQEKDCVSTTESFKNDDGELYVRKGGILRKLGT